MMNVHPNIQARINKQKLLEEVRYFQFMHKEILQEINSNALAVQACEQHMQELLKEKGDMEDMLFCIKLDNLLEKINAYIAMAILNEVEDDELHLKHITRLPTLFFKLHSHRIKTLRRISMHNDKFKLLYISPEIGHCHLLEILDLSYCGLTELPDSIGDIKRLRHLILRENDLSELPESIGQCENLQLLDVSHNVHLKKLPKEIGHLHNLEVLKAHHAKLKTLPKEIANCNSLLELYVDHNQLKALPVDLTRLKRLEILYVDHNNLTEIPADIADMNAIKVISVGGNNIAKIPARVLKFCKESA